MSIFSPNFIIGTIRIGTIEGASCLNMGNNFPTNFTSHKKHNQGFGSVGGDNNEFKDAKAILVDSDFIDMLNQSEEDIPDWVKEMMEQLIQGQTRQAPLD